MKGHAEIIKTLNYLLKGELTSINQYFVHAKMCENWGYENLYHHTEKEAIDEMKHAEMYMARILFLDGQPTVSELGTIKIGRDVKEQFQNDLASEMTNLKDLNDGIRLCFEKGDSGTKQLLETILKDEEKHIDWLETQLHLIEELGYEQYLMEQTEGGEE